MNFQDGNTQKRYFKRMISGDQIFYYFSLNGTLFIDSKRPYEPFNEGMKDEFMTYEGKSPDYVNFIIKPPF